jgi:hypothetical protein
MIVAGEEYEATSSDGLVWNFPKVTFEKSGKVQFVMDIYSDANQNDKLSFTEPTFGKDQLN